MYNIVFETTANQATLNDFSIFEVNLKPMQPIYFKEMSLLLIDID